MARFATKKDALFRASIKPRNYRFLFFAAAAFLLFVENVGLRGGQTSEWDAEWRAAYVIKSDFVVEVDGSWIAAGFTADTDCDVFLGCTAAFDSDLDEFANTIDVDGLEWIEFVDLLVVVIWEELSGIVTAEAHGELSQVVGSEAEELGFIGEVSSL